MKKNEQLLSKRNEIEGIANKVYRELLLSPSIEAWRAKVHPVDRMHFESNLCKVFAGAAELLWIGENDCVWVPYCEGDIHILKGEAIKRIRDFITIYPSIEILHNPIVQSNLLAKAERISNAINIEDANDRVWEQYRGAIKSHGTAASPNNLEPDWNALYLKFNERCINPGNWNVFVRMLEEHRKGDDIDMARIAWVLQKAKMLNERMAWCAWYSTFCECCGIIPNKTYTKDAGKLKAGGDAMRKILDDFFKTNFIVEKRGGDIMHHHHIPIEDRDI